MAVAPLDRDVRLPKTAKAFAAGTYNFTTTVYRTIGPTNYYLGPAVRIVALAASSWSLLKDCDDQNAPLSVPSGYTHDCGVTEITSDQAFIAYFNP